jgi:hypothetical protein
MLRRNRTAQRIAILGPGVEMYKDYNLGIVWIEDKTRAIVAYSIHPMISEAKDTPFRRKMDKWKPRAKFIRACGYSFNIDMRFSPDKIEHGELLAKECKCPACRDDTDTIYPEDILK